MVDSFTNAGEMLPCTPSVPHFSSRRRKSTSSMTSPTTMSHSRIVRRGNSEDWIWSVAAIPRKILTGKAIPVCFPFLHSLWYLCTHFTQAQQDFSIFLNYLNRWVTNCNRIRIHRLLFARYVLAAAFDWHPKTFQPDKIWVLGNYLLH